MRRGRLALAGGIAALMIVTSCSGPSESTAALSSSSDASSSMGARSSSDARSSLPGMSPSSAASSASPTAAGSGAASTVSSVSTTPTDTAADAAALMSATSIEGRPDWWLTGSHVVSDPVIVGDAVAVYGIALGVYVLTVVNPSDGATLWKAKATPGYVTPGVVLRPEVVGTNLVYVEPMHSRSNYFLGRVVVADGATGRVLARTESVFVISVFPHECGGNICWQATGEYRCAEELTAQGGLDCVTLADSDEGVRSLTMDPDSGVVTERAAGAALPPYRAIGPDGLSDLIDGGERFIGRIVDDSVAWRVHAADLFGPEFSTDYGWDFARHDTVNAFIGSIGNVSDDDVIPLDERSALASFDADTGARQWLRTGLSQFCIPGVLSELSVACEFAEGTEAVRNDDGARIRGGDIALVGYEETDGRTLWSVSLSDASGRKLLDVYDSIRPVSDTELLVDTAKGARVVDVRTGEVSPLGDRVAWCGERRDATLGEDVGASDMPWLRDRAGAYSTFACDASGSPVPPSGPVPSWVGVTADNVFVYLSPQGLVGHLQSE